MKCVVIGDMHFGARGANTDLLEHQALFFSDLFSYLDSNKEIRSILLTGDVFDTRKSINIMIIDKFRQMFLSEAIKRDLSVFAVVGNHDLYYRETTAVNTLKTLLNDTVKLHPGCFTVIDEPKDVSVDGTPFFMVPWVCKENHDAVLKAIKESKAKYALGHFEFDGFEMQRGQVMKTSHSHKDYSKFDLVISGHYHSKSKKDNVLYTGTPYELTWMDYADDKGFWVFDDGDMSFIRNKNTLHNRIHYSDGFAPDVGEVAGKYVQLIIDRRIPDKELTSYLNALYAMKPYEIKVNENYAESLSISVIDTKVKDTGELIRDYVMDSAITLDKDKMISMMQNLYRQAVTSK
jgi:DNA repair exonuclease SbcCD nuclease subunit